MPDGEVTASTVENVRVVVRVRPPDERERLERTPICVTVDTTNATIGVTRANANPPEPPRIYAYDAVFDADTTQMDIYVQTASPIVEQVLRGYNGTILAYGQTGTGKTYTMAGATSAPELRGIIPNSFAHIFAHIAKADDKEKFLVCVTYLEIYNEEVRDLLGADARRALEVKERPDIGVFVKDLTGYVVHDADELEKIMCVGNRNRQVAATAMNTESSRSHAIFSITVERSTKSHDTGKSHVTMGKLHLVDLAGSERQSKTQAVGARLREATKINQSLSVLGNVISALVDGKSTHIPYRNSKLTRLLQDSLGGNSKTVMIATVGPAESNYVETISTLRYASRAKSIENRTHVNSEPGDALLTRFQQEIDQLKKQLEESTTVEEIVAEEELEEEEDSGEEVSDTDIDDNLTPDERRARRKQKKEMKVSRRNFTKAQANLERAQAARRALEEKRAELQRTKQQQDELRDKLQRLQSKVIVGGEDLLARADAQRRLLEQAAKELEARRANEQRLQDHLQRKEAERIDLEERYSTLQEENAAKTRKLKRAVQLLDAAKAELADQQRDQQREMEGILDSIRALRRELALAELVLAAHVPPEYMPLLEQNVIWSEPLGEWQVRALAYTGNNMRNSTIHAARDNKIKYAEPVDLSDRYLSYASVNGAGAGRSAISRLARPLTVAQARH
ncbi:Kinesin-like protein KIF3A [Eumeta japonica]|uniref:Kinesin-like protein n=1 Tax=Eumeta variegata TaxID=151549 RepID=A0A4C1W386_EUMVA|nr:Kinesin-like protein KIF3A [Eumeta japonica]